MMWMVMAAIVYSLMLVGVAAWIEWGYTWDELFPGGFGRGWLVPKMDMTEPDYKGHKATGRYDPVNGATLYDVGGLSGDAKYIDWLYGGPPPGVGPHIGYHIDEWGWDGKEWNEE